MLPAAAGFGAKGRTGLEWKIQVFPDKRFV
jgi:hypothetical protein